MSSYSARDLLVLPVHVRLGGVEDVEVPLPGRAIGVGHTTPAAATEDAAPVVRGEVAVRAGPVAEDVTGALRGAGLGGERGPEPLVLAARVVGHEVDQDLEPEGVSGVNEHLGVVQRAEAWVDVAVVGDVVAGVVHRRDVERREPHRVDAEVAQVGQARRDARQVADAVTVAVAPTARIDLVDHRVPPPRAVGGVGRVDQVGEGRCVGHPPHFSVCRARHQTPRGQISLRYGCGRLRVEFRSDLAMVWVWSAAS
jgi:hypothetical protein